jgi:hypothetical protein
VLGFVVGREVPCEFDNRAFEQVATAILKLKSEDAQRSFGSRFPDSMQPPTIGLCFSCRRGLSTGRESASTLEEFV